MEPQIGFIGLGMMGKPMAMCLLEKGFPLMVYNRTREKASDLLEWGALRCESLNAVMEQSDIWIASYFCWRRAQFCQSVRAHLQYVRSADLVLR